MAVPPPGRAPGAVGNIGARRAPASGGRPTPDLAGAEPFGREELLLLAEGKGMRVPSVWGKGHLISAAWGSRRPSRPVVWRRRLPRRRRFRRLGREEGGHQRGVADGAGHALGHVRHATPRGETTKVPAGRNVTSAMAVAASYVTFSPLYFVFFSLRWNGAPAASYARGCNWGAPGDRVA